MTFYMVHWTDSDGKEHLESFTVFDAAVSCTILNDGWFWLKDRKVTAKECIEYLNKRNEYKAECDKIINR